MLYQRSDLASEVAQMSASDEHLNAEIDAVNLVLNRARVATFVARFAEDKDVRDLLALDILGCAAGLPLSSTGLTDPLPSLALRPFRLWEYTWLYKSLRLSEGGMKILDLGGSASHLPILAALAGCKVTTLDINAAFVQAAQEVAHGLNLRSFDACVGDMRDLSGFPEDSFDTVLCCSVLEHLTAHDQELTLMQMARVLKPGGAIGLTFDYGTPAPGANEHLPPPHEPPLTAAEVLRRYLQGPLLLAGNAFTEDPIPGALFHDEHIRYTVASLFLTKSPAFPIDVPKCEPAGTVLGGLVIQDLPSRVYKTVTRAQQAAYELEQSLEEERQHAAVLEAIASERLIAMQEKEDLIMRLNGELRKLGERRLFQRVFPRLFWRDRIRK